MPLKFTCLLFVLLASSIYLKAQEQTKAMQYSHSLNRANERYVQRGVIGDTLQLPFFDDFAQSAPYPKSSHWVDRKVFVNNSMGYLPPSIGVATFDGFDEKGKPYINSQFAYGFCDSLTSIPIDLDRPAADSIYLSFYIQAQGYGREPAPNDSLILEFRNRNTGKFVKVRAWPGSKRKDFKNMLIAITDSAYLYKGFQFRFRNKGSQFGGDDHWHVDYVKLDAFRNFIDTLNFDVSLNSNASSLLNSYTAVPYNQYDTSMLASNHFVSIKNNFFPDPITNVNFTFASYLRSPLTFLDSVTKGLPMPPNSSSYEESKKVRILPQTQAFKVDTRYIVTTNNDLIKSNDTIVSTQNFSDYFSYDDGTAEDGYGLSVSGDGRFAYLFNARNEDTLTAIDIYFTQKQVPITNQIFTLTIWKSLDPELIVYQKTSLSPLYIDTLNGFARYTLDSVVKVQADFYVGWIQSSNFFMNVGLDRNTINNNRMFFKVNSIGWQ